MVFSSPVPPHFSGLPLQNYLARRFTYHELKQWREHIVAGRVTLNGERVDCMAEVTAGDIVSFEPPPFEEPPADTRYGIVYDDPWLLGVDKPGNLLVHRAGRSFTNNLIRLLRSAPGAPWGPELHIVNRLDRHTSGVVLVAKQRAALVTMNASLARGEVDKEYTAIVEGIASRSAFTVDRPIGKMERAESGAPKYRVDPDRGKPARTDLELVRRLGPSHSLVTARPRTGRTHQIRVHLAWAGLPIAGDTLYGAVPEAPGIGRQALHCRALAFRHPRSGEPVKIAAPVPDDMRKLERALEGVVGK